MASAYKCDRCGKLYSDEARAREVYLRDKDLCPKCQSQLDDWFVDPYKAVVSFVEIDDDGHKYKYCPYQYIKEEILEIQEPTQEAETKTKG